MIKRLNCSGEDQSLSTEFAEPPEEMNILILGETGAHKATFVMDVMTWFTCNSQDFGVFFFSRLEAKSELVRPTRIFLVKEANQKFAKVKRVSCNKDLTRGGGCLD